MDPLILGIIVALIGLFSFLNISKSSSKRQAIPDGSYSLKIIEGITSESRADAILEPEGIKYWIKVFFKYHEKGDPRLPVVSHGIHYRKDNTRLVATWIGNLKKLQIELS